MKKFFIISGLGLLDNNRGTAALGYGAFSFLKEKGFLHEGQALLKISYRRYPWEAKDKVEEIEIQGKTWKIYTMYFTSVEHQLFNKFGILIPGTKYYNAIKNIDFVAAINGGDGFSDIYNTETFMKRLPYTLFAMRARIPVIQLPQTLGPFKNKKNQTLAEKILRYSSHVFVRDDKYIPELDRMGIKYELTKDLSAYMSPEPWGINILPNSIGINVSGLCYSNTFRSLSGQFDAYPELIDRLIKHFQAQNKTIYLIPHSYNYQHAEDSNDDIVACKEAYKRLEDKTNVILLDEDLISPRVKYVISKMSFFIGTRMHANFAAIYTGVPVFGLAYSYKFAGAFNANGLNGENQTYMINNMKDEQISDLISQIDKVCQEKAQITNTYEKKD